jgi:hypothetical protein
VTAEFLRAYAKFATTGGLSKTTNGIYLRLLRAVFGITYCIKNEAFRTEKVNFVFAVNAELNSLSEEDHLHETNLRKSKHSNFLKSCLVSNWTLKKSAMMKLSSRRMASTTPASKK